MQKRQYANLISLQQLTDRYTPLYLGERKNKRTKDHLKQKNSLWEPDLLNGVFFLLKEFRKQKSITF